VQQNSEFKFDVQSKVSSVKKPEADNDFFNFDLPDSKGNQNQEIADFFQLD
jgi:hypothetical protein